MDKEDVLKWIHDKVSETLRNSFGEEVAKAYETFQKAIVEKSKSWKDLDLLAKCLSSLLLETLSRGALIKTKHVKSNEFKLLFGYLSQLIDYLTWSSKIAESLAEGIILGLKSVGFALDDEEMRFYEKLLKESKSKVSG